MKKGMMQMDLIITIAMAVFVCALVFSLWYVFQVSAGKTSSGIVYNIIDNVYRG